MKAERLTKEKKEKALRFLLNRLNAPEFIDARDEFSESYLCIATIMESYASIEVAEATKETYPAVFLDWVLFNQNVYKFKTAKKFIVYDDDDAKEGIEMSGFDELFEWWKQNIRK